MQIIKHKYYIEGGCEMTDRKSLSFRMPGIGVIFTILAFLWPASVYADLEAVAHGVANFTGSGECCSGCSDNDWFTEYAELFIRYMDSFSYDLRYLWENKQVDPEDMVDAEKRPTYGADDVSPYGTDWADAIFISTHGSHVCDDVNHVYFSGFWVGEYHSGQTCTPNTRDHIKWGDDDANAVIIFGCRNAQLCVWEHGGYSQMHAGHFDILMGFHGRMWLNQDAYDRLDAYLADTKYNHMGEYWVDYLTDLKFWSWENPDQCATAILWGPTESAVDDLYYNAGWLDIHFTGAHNLTFYYYWDPCDPWDGEPL